MIDLHDGRQVIGYHGTTQEVADEVLHLQNKLKPSTNDYDWLGSGIYFWEYNFQRAWKWAEQSTKESNQKTSRNDQPFVLGAVINLGRCLDLVSSDGLDALAKAYQGLENFYSENNFELPDNSTEVNGVVFKRELDCLVINHYKRY